MRYFEVWRVNINTVLKSNHGSTELWWKFNLFPSSYLPLMYYSSAQKEKPLLPLPWVQQQIFAFICQEYQTQKAIAPWGCWRYLLWVCLSGSLKDWIWNNDGKICPWSFKDFFNKSLGNKVEENVWSGSLLCSSSNWTRSCSTAFGLLRGSSYDS